MSTRTRRHAGRITLAVVKDMILFSVGAALIIRQGFYVPVKEFNWVVMAFGAIIAGVPGALQIWGLRTGGSTSLPELPPSPSPSPSSSNV